MAISEEFAKVAFGERNEAGKALASQAVQTAVDGFYRNCDMLVQSWMNKQQNITLADIKEAIKTIGQEAANLMDKAFQAISNLR